MENIVIICVDSLRADGTNYTRKIISPQAPSLKTPNLDSFIKNGTLFSHSYSTNTYTTAAHGSMFTGTYPPTHGIRSFFDAKQTLSTKTTTLAEELEKHNYQSFFYSDIPENFSYMNIWRGFKVKTYNRLNWLWSSIEELKKKQNFIFIHLFGVHEPYGFVEDLSAEASINDDYYDIIVDLRTKLNLKSPLNPRKKPHDAWQEVRKVLIKENLDQRSILEPYYNKGIEKFDAVRFPFIINKLEMLGFNNNNTLIITLSDHGEGTTELAKSHGFAHGGEVTESVIRNFFAVNKKDIPINPDNIFSLAFLKHFILHYCDIKKIYNPPLVNMKLLPFSFFKKGYVYAESFLNYVSDNLPHGLTDKGGIILLAQEKGMKIPNVLKHRALISKHEKFVLNGKPEYLAAPISYNQKQFVHHFFEAAFSRLPSANDMAHYTKLLKKKMVSPAELVQNFLLSAEKKEKPFCATYKIKSYLDEELVQNGVHALWNSRIFLEILNVSKSSNVHGKKLYTMFRY